MRSAIVARRRFGEKVALPSMVRDLAKPGPSFQAPLVDARRFAATDGPFRHIRPRFTEKKKHYNEVLVMANRRKLLETGQDLLSEPHKQYPRAFWEVFSKRSVQSMHLFEPLETAILLRALDVHDVRVKGHDVFVAAVPYIRAAKKIPGAAIFVFADVLPRRLSMPPEELAELLKHLGRCASDVMWEMTPAHAVNFLNTLNTAGVRDAALTARISRKFFLHLGAPVVGFEDVTAAADALKGQQHRDLELLNGLAHRAIELHELKGSTPACATAAQSVLGAFEALEVDGAPEAMRKLAPSQSSTTV